MSATSKPSTQTDDCCAGRGAESSLQLGANKPHAETAQVRAVADAHFFSSSAEKCSVIYLLNQGYCNVQCAHCYVNRVKSRPLRRTREQAEADIKKLKAQGYRVLLRGTEVLLHDDYLPLFRAAGQDYVQTNGVHIVRHPEILDRLQQEGIRYLIISYLFDPEGMIDVPSRIADTAISLAASRFGVTVSVIVTRNVASNLATLKDFCEHVANHGARAVKFIRLIPVTPDLLPFAPTPEQSRAALLYISQRKAHFPYERLVLQTPGCFGMFQFRRSLAQGRFSAMDLSSTYDCPAGKKHFAIDVQNTVYPCLYLMSPEDAIGKLIRGRIEIAATAVPPGSLRTPECPAYVIRQHSLQYKIGHRVVRYESHPA